MKNFACMCRQDENLTVIIEIPAMHCSFLSLITCLIAAGTISSCSDFDQGNAGRDKQHHHGASRYGAGTKQNRLLQASQPSHQAPVVMKLGKTVPMLAGYVRTPFTSPPRLVDARSFHAGDKIVCPYTHHVIILPPNFIYKSAPWGRKAEDTPKLWRPGMVLDGAMKSDAATHQIDAGAKHETSDQSDDDIEKPTHTKTVAHPKPQSPKDDVPNQDPTPSSDHANSQPDHNPVLTGPASTPPSAPEPPVTPPAPTTPAAPAPHPAAEDLPVAQRVPNRSTLVYSPYVNDPTKMVDISEFKPGSKVRCPYSGKLFKVPADQPSGTAIDPATPHGN